MGKRQSFRQGKPPVSNDVTPDLTSNTWMVDRWSFPAKLKDVSDGLPSDSGLYRIWGQESDEILEYVGETSNIKSRLKTHKRNRNENLNYSYCKYDGYAFQRSQAETDLLGGHWLVTGEPPRDQY